MQDRRPEQLHRYADTVRQTELEQDDPGIGGYACAIHG